MKKLGFILKYAGCLCIPFALYSCVSTDTIDSPVEPEENGKPMEIVLNVGANAEAGTRADSNHKLRYIAKLYKGTSNNKNEDVYSRQEIVQDDENNNQVIFTVPSGSNYTIYLFADYIPANAQKKSTGLYDDYYYNTSVTRDNVDILTTPGNPSSEKIDPLYFNNDNYDCFADTLLIYKTDLKVERDVVLKRIVSKIRFVDTSKNSGSYTASVSKVELLTRFDWNNFSNSFFKEKRSCNVNIVKEFNGQDEQEVLFFYSFAGKDLSTKEKVSLSFTPTGVEDPFDISNIEINRNYITTVKGNFLPSLNSAPEPEDPSEELEFGPIYLNLSVTSDPWLNMTSTWP